MTQSRILLFIFLYSFGMAAQPTDYLKIRDAVKNISCEVTDSSSIYSTIRNLLAMDTTSLTQNLDIYYEDLGMSYWLLSGGSKDNPYLDQAIAAMNSALFHKPLSTSVFWGLAFMYNMKGDCAKSLHFMEAYKLNTKKKYWQRDQEKMLRERCGNGG